MVTPTRNDVVGWTPAERAQVARWLDELVPRPFPGSRPLGRRRLVIVVTGVGAALLLPWIAYLSVSLPPTHSVRAWNILWVGFDVALACCLALTGWLVAQRRQLAMYGLVVAATLLVCDAWFDVGLSLNTDEQSWALAAALLIELPVAVFLASSAVRILRRSAAITQQLRGRDNASTPLRQQRFVTLPSGKTKARTDE